MPSKYKTAKDRAAVMPGYPVEFKFIDPEKLREYFAGDTIVCLQCGKQYRTLGVHLQTMHDMEPDEYRDIYGIPWTYGLSCGETTSLHAEDARQQQADGVFRPFADAAAAEAARLARHRKRQPVRDTYSMRNLEMLNAGKTGEAQRRREAAPKRGTPDYREKMQNRHQCKNPPDSFRKWWEGKEQTDEHVLKRTGYHKKSNDQAHVPTGEEA